VRPPAGLRQIRLARGSSLSLAGMKLPPNVEVLRE